MWSAPAQAVPGGGRRQSPCARHCAGTRGPWGWQHAFLPAVQPIVADEPVGRAVWPASPARPSPMPVVQPDGRFGGRDQQDHLAASFWTATPRRCRLRSPLWHQRRCTDLPQPPCHSRLLKDPDTMSDLTVEKNPYEAPPLKHRMTADARRRDPTQRPPGGRQPVGHPRCPSTAAPAQPLGRQRCHHRMPQSAGDWMWADRNTGRHHGVRRATPALRGTSSEMAAAGAELDQPGAGLGGGRTFAPSSKPCAGPSMPRSPSMEALAASLALAV